MPRKECQSPTTPGATAWTARRWDASAVERLDYLVFDEGLAHFLGFPGARNGIHRLRKREWEKAEELLAAARARMARPGLTGREVEDCLRRASTGSYWEKFGSVAGLCRASQLHERGGVGALVESVRKKALALS